ncbi:MAG TPA: hypothetical protein VGQ19_18125 [Burkholderiales bacterium]|jgi:hypothetical protein|nr:hypothetical protein [Burkholderiales bacterium]
MSAGSDALDLNAEVAWAELILASEDMRATIAQIDRIPKDGDEFDLFYGCVGVIASYGRPFKPNNRRRIIGEPFLSVLNAQELQLHEKVIDLRDRDHVHSDLYEKRVRVKAMHADVFVRSGADLENLADDDIEITFSHSQQMTVRGLGREDLGKLRGIAEKLRAAIKERGQTLGADPLARRIRLGYHDWFVLGSDDPPRTEAA